MSYREFREWMEYYKQEPFGDDWLQAGTIAATTVNANPFSKRTVKPERFFPKVRTQQDPADVERQMMHWARMHNQQVERQANGAHRQN